MDNPQAEIDKLLQQIEDTDRRKMLLMEEETKLKESIAPNLDELKEQIKDVKNHRLNLRSEIKFIGSEHNINTGLLLGGATVIKKAVKTTETKCVDGVIHFKNVTSDRCDEDTINDLLGSYYKASEDMEIKTEAITVIKQTIQDSIQMLNKEKTTLSHSKNKTSNTLMSLASTLGVQGNVSDILKQYGRDSIKTTVKFQRNEPRPLYNQGIRDELRKLIGTPLELSGTIKVLDDEHKRGVLIVNIHNGDELIVDHLFSNDIRMDEMEALDIGDKITFTGKVTKYGKLNKHTESPVRENYCLTNVRVLGVTK